jgi:GAF domain-containing protein
MNGYRLDNVEVTRHGPVGQRSTYLISSIGIIQNGFLVGAWNIRRDVTEARYTEARLQEYASRLESQNKDLAVVHRVAVAAANATDEDALIEETTHIIGRTLYPDVFGVLVIDEEEGVLRPHPSYRGIDHDVRNQEIPLGQSITGHVARTGETKRVNDVTQEPLYVPLYETIRSEMCVPIRIGQRIIGVINVESVQGNAFSASDERLLTICAGQLATAIEQLRTEAKEQRRQVWREKVLELGKIITQITDWDTCVRQIHHITRVVSLRTLGSDGSWALRNQSTG